jgi:hypothetical protein
MWRGESKGTHFGIWSDSHFDQSNQIFGVCHKRRCTAVVWAVLSQVWLLVSIHVLATSFVPGVVATEKVDGTCLFSVGKTGSGLTRRTGLEFEQLYLRGGGETILQVATSVGVPAESEVVMNMKNSSHSTLRVVFSDVDGTLVHYPGKPQNVDHVNPMLYLPPSKTGMRGIISSRTLQLCRKVRQSPAGNNKRVRFVLISGMRTSTLIQRLPFLPKADAYCCEAGGRIFYPTELNSEMGGNNENIVAIIHPKSFLDASEDDLKPFGVIEDMEWRSQISQVDAAGSDGYNDVPVMQRKGSLWDYARALMSHGYSIDSTGYSSCFRVNRKQQDPSQIGIRQWDALTSRTLMTSLSVDAYGLDSSVNLGCVDFYPRHSGKKNWYVSSDYDNNLFHFFAMF